MLMPSPARLSAETLAAELAKLPLLSAATGSQVVPAQIAIARAIASGQSTDEIATALSTPSGWENILPGFLLQQTPAQSGPPPVGQGADSSAQPTQPHIGKISGALTYQGYHFSL
jgi:hypothetical protein